MNFDTWEPVYEAICADMGYERTADEAARDRLAEMLEESNVMGLNQGTFEGETVAVVAPGPRLDAERDILRQADAIIAAGRAADWLLERDVQVDWVVTDLDGHTADVPTLTHGGLPVAIHAHGDNQDLIERVVPECAHESVLPTTQIRPAGPVQNVGGFTDGDRAAFLADALGAEELLFPGWDLSDPTVGIEKARKLAWAARLLAWLERRRNEQFGVLDGLRDDLDLSAIPIAE